MSKNGDVLEKIGPFHEALIEAEVPAVFIGGTGSEALKYPTTYYDSKVGGIYPADGFVIPLRRTDGSPVDIDLQINCTDQATVETAKKLGKKHLPDMEVKPFGIHTDDVLDEQTRRPFGWKAIRVATVDRYLQDDPGHPDTVLKVGFPFAAEVTDLIKPWHMYLPNRQPLPVPSPQATIANYLTRSMGGGLRGRYDEKMGHIVSNVLEAMPEVREYFMDGPGQAQLALAGCLRSIATIHHPNKPWLIGEADRLQLEIPVPKWRELHEQESFLLHFNNRAVQESVLLYCKAKAIPLKFYEGNKALMWVWHHANLERLVQGITNND